MDVAEEETAMNKTVEDALKHGVLESDYHAPLIRNLKKVVVSSRVPKKMILNKAEKFCQEPDREYIWSWYENVDEGYAGFVIANTEFDNAQRRLEGMAGMCLRNQIWSEVVTLSEVFDRCKDEDQRYDLEQVRCLVIPDFQTSERGKLKEWQVDRLFALLTARRGHEAQTLLYAEDYDHLGDYVGNSVAGLIGNAYCVLVGD